METPIYLLHDADGFDALEAAVIGPLCDRFGDDAVLPVVYEEPSPPVWPEGTTVIACLGDDALHRVIPMAAEQGWQLGLLPHPRMVQTRIGLGIAAKTDDALADILSADGPMEIDLLFCNERPVFHSVVIGDVFDLLGGAPKESLGERIRRLFRSFPARAALRLMPYTFTTDQNKTVATAALGVVIVEHGDSSLAARGVLENAHITDGMLHALILAPRSLVELAYFLLTSALTRSKAAGKLPPFVGHIRSAGLRVESPQPMALTHDGTMMSTREVVLRVAPAALRLLPGRHLTVEGARVPGKETFRVQTLPTGEARAALSYRSLPLLRQATTEEFHGLFQALRENARPRPSYLTLMVLSTLLAAIGLFANSTPVIIGAMILAPMMAPIISLAMALARQDARLMFDSVKTLAWGSVLALGSAMVASWALPLRAITPEIAARLSPTLLDLGVAAIAGIAGAYAHAREEVAKSLAGVAIAVALVPPLAVVGIGMGWGDWTVIWGAGLLFLTNLFGIVLTASLSFFVLGFSAFRRAQRGLLVSFFLVGAISIPLGFGFHQMASESAVVRALEGWETGGVTLRDIEVRPGDPLELSVKLLSPFIVDGTTVEAVKQAVEERIGREVHLEATAAIVR